MDWRVNGGDGLHIAVLQIGGGAASGTPQLLSLVCPETHSTPPGGAHPPGPSWAGSPVHSASRRPCRKGPEGAATQPFQRPLTLIESIQCHDRLALAIVHGRRTEHEPNPDRSNRPRNEFLCPGGFRRRLPGGLGAPGREGLSRRPPGLYHARSVRAERSWQGVESLPCGHRIGLAEAV